MRGKTIQVPQHSNLILVQGIELNGEIPVTVAYAGFIVYSTDGTVLINKSLGNGISYTDGIFSINLAPADTTNMLGSYTYEVAVSVSGSDQYTPTIGLFDVIRTRSRLV